MHKYILMQTLIPQFKLLPITYRKWGKIRWAKLSQFLRFLSLPQKFSREFLAIGK